MFLECEVEAKSQNALLSKERMVSLNGNVDIRRWEKDGKDTGDCVIYYYGDGKPTFKVLKMSYSELREMLFSAGLLLADARSAVRPH